MEGPAGFLAELTAAVAAREAWIATSEIPRLAETLRAFHSQFESIVALLIRKGLLREDPYNYDQAVSDISVPSDQPLPETENVEELSYRLAGCRRQLEFLATGMKLSPETLDLPILKKIAALVGWINWADFGEGSRSPVTRAFARVLMKVRMGPDPIAAGVLKDAHLQVEKSQGQVRALVAGLVSFHRESWKLGVRTAALPRVPPALLSAEGRREEALAALRAGFAQALPGRPWYPELAGEILAEERGPDAEARRARVLAGLAVPAAREAQSPPAESAPLRPLLVEAARAAVRGHAELSSAFATLVENQRILESRGRSLGERLRQWILRLVGQKDAGRVYQVEYSDAPAGSPRMERIPFPEFSAEAQKKLALLASLATPAGAARLEAAAEPGLLEFIDRLLSDLLLLHRRMGALNVAFQARAAEGRQAGIKGIRLELVAVKNSIVKANQKRHEYVARREEREQLARLRAPAR
jgi:hypothetical protein